MICFHLDLSISTALFFKKPSNHRIKGVKKGRPRKSQTSEDGISNENEFLPVEGDQPYLSNDGTTSSSSFDGMVPNNFASTDLTAEMAADTQGFGVNGGTVPGSNTSTGDASDHVEPSVDSIPKEADGLVSSKIKKPRRSEEFSFFVF